MFVFFIRFLKRFYVSLLSLLRIKIWIRRNLQFPDKRINLTTQISDIMYRHLFRFVVMTVTILTINLLNNAISKYIVSYKNHYKPIVFTLLGMAVTVVILYPLFIKLESWIKNISVKAIKSGRSVAGKYFGLLFTFLTALLILFYFYAKMWYHIDFFQVLLHGKAGG